MASTFRNLRTLSLSFSSFLFFLVSVYSLHFQISRFDLDEANIQYLGDAAPRVGEIDFNIDANYLYQVGWAIYSKRVLLWSSSTGQLTDFTTHFSFHINTLGTRHYGHGLAFFLAPVGFEIPPNSASGFLGLFNVTTAVSSNNQIVLVEFDSYVNNDWDPPMQHVGINNCSIASAVYIHWHASLHSGDTVDAWVTYTASTKNLIVSWKYRGTSDPRENTSLSYQIDLKKILPEWVKIGFSAATGKYKEHHILQTWEFNSTLDVIDTGVKERKWVRLMRILTFTGLVFILGLGAVTAYAIFWRRNRMKKKKSAAMHIT